LESFSKHRMITSPTLRLLIGLMITLAAVAGYSSYTLHQLESLRRLQTDTIDLNRHDSLLLLEAESNLNRIGLRVRDIMRPDEKGNVARYSAEFDRLHAGLQDAIEEEEKLSPVSRKAAEHAKLIVSLKLFWTTSDQLFSAARAGREAEARRIASTQLFSQQTLLAGTLSDLLKQNNEAEERADDKVSSIYAGVQRDIYGFLAATILGILITSTYTIFSNRRMFAHMESMARQRRILAARLITVQEEVLRSVSRELHDEFGQILTAVGAMLARAERKGLAPDSPLRTELTEVRQITHATLEKMRSLSQMLHPSVIDDYGLVKGVQWYVGVFEKQTGIETTCIVEGVAERITGQRATHCFRIVQEALNNAAKHSGAKRAEVEMRFGADSLTVTVMDFGKGLKSDELKADNKGSARRGLGLIAMRERASLLGGTVHVHSTPGAGTTVVLTMPLQQSEAMPVTHEQELEEALSPKA
jgi:signal transduction histidine kinase